MNRQYGALNGIAICLIVLNHAIHFCLQVSPAEGLWLQGLSLVQALGTFAVPVFLFVSGAFLAYAADEFSWRFLKANLERILWPYLIWSGVFYLLIAATIGAYYPLHEYARNLLIGYPYHFVPLLVFWYLAAPVLVPVARRHPVALLLGMMAYKCCLLVVLMPETFGGQISLPGWASVLAPPVLAKALSIWGIYLPLGVVLSLHGSDLRRYLVSVRPAAMAAILVLFAVAIAHAFGQMSAAWAQIAAPIPLMLLLPTIDRAAIPALRWFEYLGRQSYGVYLTHFIVLNLAVFGAAKLELVGPGWSGVVLPVLLATSLGGPLLLMALPATGPISRRAYRYFFGAAPPARRYPRQLIGNMPA